MEMTIIIPVYNRAAVVEKTLLSVFRQSYRPLHLILVDNCSTDDSLVVLKSFQERYDSSVLRVTVCEEPVLGAPFARNAGLRRATSEWVMFFDSDDEMCPGEIARIVQTIREGPSLDIVGFPVWLRSPAGRLRRKRTSFTGKMKAQIFHSVLSTSCFAVRRTYLVAAGGWNESLSRWQDWELGIRLLSHVPRIAWIKRPPLAVVQESADSITGNGYARSHAALVQAIDAAASSIQASNLPDKERLSRCVYSRLAELSGLYLREDAPDLSQEAWSLFLQRVELSAGRQMLCRRIRRYIACGGRLGGRILSLVVR
ncbi:MAG: glycosyltransferase family 2 protein [Porphyromonadaceae bacterium]|nr:glycosyltransferase family 2 protein [Porphyromonadaceae bacterium]